MKAGDLVHDVALGLNGIIISKQITTVNPPRGFYRWIVFYEDGVTDMAHTNELEVISESR